MSSKVRFRGELSKTFKTNKGSGKVMGYHTYFLTAPWRRRSESGGNLTQTVLIYNICFGLRGRYCFDHRHSGKRQNRKICPQISFPKIVFVTSVQYCLSKWLINRNKFKKISSFKYLGDQVGIKRQKKCG